MMLTRKLFIAVGMGATLECYDFMICAFMATYLSMIFFPGYSLLGIFSIFTIAFFSRPIGGLFWGHLGDRYGRRKIFSLTMLLLVLPTLGIALFPVQYCSTLANAFGFIILRFLQGFLVGGEFSGGVTFIAETAATMRRGFIIASFMTFLSFGTVFASMITLLLNILFSKLQILTWAWRIPFLISVILIIIAIYIRKKTEETPLFLSLKQRADISNIPLFSLFKNHFYSVLKGFVITCASTFSVITFYLYLPQLLRNIPAFSARQVLDLTTVGTLLLAILTPLAGYLADCFGRKIIFATALILLNVTFFLFYLALYWSNFILLIVAMMFTSIFFAGINANYCTLLSELFPTQVRFSGVALCYNFSFAVCGGIIPLLYVYFNSALGILSLPLIFLVTITVSSLYALTNINDEYKKDLIY